MWEDALDEIKLLSLPFLATNSNDFNGFQNFKKNPQNGRNIKQVISGGITFTETTVKELDLQIDL